jgi:hypothetical protein
LVIGGMVVRAAAAGFEKVLNRANEPVLSVDLLIKF